MNVRWKIAQSFESLWWQVYLLRRPVEGYLDWKAGYWRDFLEDAGIEIGEGEDILDAGCGPAGINMVLGKSHVTAIDPLLETYRYRLAHFRPQRGVHYICTGLEAYETGKSFDKIFCLNVINHVHDISRSLAKLRSLLKEGGKLYLSVDAHNYLALKVIFRWLPGDILHPHQYDLAEYKEMVESTGLKVHKTRLLKAGFVFDYYLIEAIHEV